jgi:hypothetical protein
MIETYNVRYYYQDPRHNLPTNIHFPVDQPNLRKSARKPKTVITETRGYSSSICWLRWAKENSSDLSMIYSQNLGKIQQMSLVWMINQETEYKIQTHLILKCN